MQNYDFLLNAGQPVALMQAAGVNVYYKTGVEAAGLTGVRVKGEGGGLDIVLLPGEGIRLPTEQSRFTLTRADSGAADVAGTMLIGNAEFSASRVQGDVSILNGAGLASANAAEQRRVDDGQGHRYGSRANTYAPGTANCTFGMRLRNPAASGKLLIVRRVLLSRREANTDNSMGWLYLSTSAAITSNGGGGFAETVMPMADGASSVGLLSAGGGLTHNDYGWTGNTTQVVLVGTAPTTWETELPYPILPGQSLSMGCISTVTTFDRFGLRIEWAERDL